MSMQHRPQRRIFLDWLKSAFKPKSVVIFRNWKDLYFVYLSLKPAKKTQAAFLSGSKIECVSFMWNNARSSGWLQQQHMQRRLKRNVTYDGILVLVHMPSLKNKRGVSPICVDIDDSIALYAVDLLLKTLKRGNAIKTADGQSSRLSTVSRQLEDIVHAAININCKKDIPKTFEEMEIQIDLGV